MRPLLISLTTLLSILVSCYDHQNSVETSQFSGNAMTIEYHITIGKKVDEEARNNIEETIRSTFNEINAIYNKWNSHSEISQLNRAKKDEKIVLSPHLANFLQRTDQMVRLTEGRFDPTIESIQHIWKEAFGKGIEPKADQLEQALTSLGWHHVHLEAVTFYKDHDLTHLDLGGIAKGYCVDLLVERLKEKGYSDIFVEWGGEIRASGKHPSGRPWRIFISKFGDPNPATALEYLELHDQAIATSGDYLQSWQVGDLIYSHIIDPRLCRPILCTKNSIASVSVLAANCTFADALATALMLFPSKEEATAWAESLKVEYPELQVWIFSRGE